MGQLQDEPGLVARRRKLGIIISIIIALVVIISSSSLIFMRPPYPSENTPISVISHGVRWTYDGSNYYGSGQQLYQIMIRDQAGQDAAWSLYGINLNATGTHLIGVQLLGDLRITLTVEKVSLYGAFNAGDYIDLILSSPATFQPDTVYTLSVYFSNDYYYSYGNPRVYDFAFHNGALYSWVLNSGGYMYGI